MFILVQIVANHSRGKSHFIALFLHSDSSERTQQGFYSYFLRLILCTLQCPLDLNEATSLVLTTKIAASICNPIIQSDQVFTTVIYCLFQGLFWYKFCTSPLGEIIFYCLVFTFRLMLLPNRKSNTYLLRYLSHAPKTNSK